MRLAIIRQRYAPSGVAERYVEAAAREANTRSLEPVDLSTLV